MFLNPTKSTENPIKIISYLTLGPGKAFWGPPGGLLGAPWGPLGGILGALGASWKPLGGLVGASWAPLGRLVGI